MLSAVIGKVLRGDCVAGLLRYLFGPGRANEHVDPHVVGRWDDGFTLVAGDARPDQPQRRQLARQLEQPLAALLRQPDKAVWHCSLRAAPGDRRLSDDEWAAFARDVLDRTGLALRDDDTGCRWVAVRHADDHIHLVVTLARQDGRPARTSQDFYRVGEACRHAERQFGLTATAPRDGTATRRPTRAEYEKSVRRARSEAPRTALQRTVRRVARVSGSETEFLDGLRSAGLLVRERRSTIDLEQVTGYAVALPTDRTAAGQPVWFGGGRLASDLTLPKVRARWAGTRLPRAEPGRSMQRQAAWAAAQIAVRRTAAEIARTTSPATAADLAQLTAGTLDVLAHLAEGRRLGPLTRAADRYDRAARQMRCVPTGAVRAGTPLRRAVRQLHHLRRVGPSELGDAWSLAVELIALVEAVGELRRRQQRHAQATAASEVAATLRAVTVPTAAAQRTYGPDRREHHHDRPSLARG